MSLQNEVGTKEIMKIENVKMHFPVRKGIFRQVVGYVKAVDGVSLTLTKGETFGIVGESGSGKTTLGRVIVGLYQPTGGKVWYVSDTGKYDISSGKIPLRVRQKIQMIFQDPLSSLDPRFTVEKALREGLEISKEYNKKEMREYLLRLLKEVGLSQDYFGRYPHELSGGQRQRISVIRAMSMKPEVVVLDEPTSALDVSVQAQTVNLLQDFQEKFNLTYVFITHDISLAKYLSNRIAVMYLGRIMEMAESEELFSNPLHPYTRALLESLPRFEARKGEKGKKKTLIGEVPSPINIPSGCRFRTRCPYATEKCEKVEPKLIDVGNGHKVACHLYEK